MPTLYDRLNILKRVKRETRVQALLRTVPHASSAESDAIVAELIGLADGGSKKTRLLPLFSLWKHLSQPAHSALLHAVGSDLPWVVDQLRGSDAPGDRAALSAILLERGASDQTLTAEQSSDPAIRLALDASLAEAANALPGDAPHGLIDRILDNAPHAGPKLRAWLAAEDEPGHMKLRTECRKRPRAWLDKHAIDLLGVPALSGIASSHIADSDDPDARAQWIAQWHLLMSRGRHRALRRHIDDRAAFEIALTPTDEVASRRGGVIWLNAVCRNEKRTTTQLASCFTDVSPLVRLTAARGLRRVSTSPEADSALLDFAFDPDPRVAECAASGLTEARSYARDLHLCDSYRALTRSPHPRVRRIAHTAVPRADEHAALLETDRLGCPIAARRAIARDRGGFVTWIKRAAAEGEPELRIRALALAARLNILDELEGEVISAIREQDERLASKAALLIGKLNGAGPSAALRYTLGHASDRVRANGVESLACVSDHEDELVPYVHDSASRVRANAIRHFLKSRSGVIASDIELTDMLSDPRPGHRLSALWAAQSAVALTLAGRIDDMSKNDPDAQVVARARSCSDAFGRLIRTGWSKSSADAPVTVTAVKPRRHVG